MIYSIILVLKINERDLNLKKREELSDFVEVYKKAIGEKEAIKSLFNEELVVRLQLQNDQDKYQNSLSKEAIFIKQNFPSFIITIPELNETNLIVQSLENKIEVIDELSKENKNSMNKGDENQDDDLVMEISPEQWEKELPNNSQPKETESQRNYENEPQENQRGNHSFRGRGAGSRGRGFQGYRGGWKKSY